MSDAPIGIFDSGVGGLTVARAVLDQLPHEPILYVGDTANSPYGPKPLAQVRACALQVMDSLVARGVKLLVIACNSASAACLRDARERYPQLPVVEVVYPAVRRAAAATRTGQVGVIGTQATITSRAYDDAFAAAPHVRLTSVACPRFVDFVERGETAGPEVLEVAENYLTPIVASGADTLILGCTHYPMLTAVISWVVGDGVTLVSSAEETAKDVHHALARIGAFRDPALPPPTHAYEATGDPEPFQRLARRFLGPQIGTVSANAGVGG